LDTGEEAARLSFSNDGQSYAQLAKLTVRPWGGACRNQCQLELRRTPL